MVASPNDDGRLKLVVTDSLVSPLENVNSN
jgi:hypothetical protein